MTPELWLPLVMEPPLDSYDDLAGAQWPRGSHVGSPRAAYYWVFPSCFDRFRDELSWTVGTPSE